MIERRFLTPVELVVGHRGKVQRPKRVDPCGPREFLVQAPDGFEALKEFQFTVLDGTILNDP